MLSRQMLGLPICVMMLLASCAPTETDAPKNNAASPADSVDAAAQTTTESAAEPAGQQTQSPMPDAAGSKDAGQATETAKPEASEPAGPIAVGDRTPDFRLKDQNGQEHTLADLLQQGNLALVFYRSADW